MKQMSLMNFRPPVNGNGPNEYSSEYSEIPVLWNEGMGTVLMQKALEVWQSIATARNDLDSMEGNQSDLSSGIDCTNDLLQLPCFSKHGSRPDEAAPWGAPPTLGHTNSRKSTRMIGLS